LNAVNNLALVPFLMAFFSSRERLPVATVTSAGESRRFRSLLMKRASGLTPPTAQCLYVLTDDNPPIADEIRPNFSHVSSLLDIAKAAPALQDLKGKHPADEERAVALGILACGKFGGREWSG
jgi:hypothetical protein